MRNHELTYRPLQGGVLIINPLNARPGTLGGIATRSGADRFLISCYHVLCRPNQDPFVDDEPILQSLLSKGGSRVGGVFAADTSAGLDCAAARIDIGVATVGSILGIGPVGAPAPPTVGMRVYKSGYVTGVTEGEIVQVQGSTVEIQHAPGYPTQYESSDFGDSGSFWVEQQSGSPVAMHTAGIANGNAKAVSLPAVLAALNLQLVLG